MRMNALLFNDLAADMPKTWFFVARLCLAAIFLFSGSTKLLFWAAGLEEFTSLGLPMPALALGATICVQISAGAALVCGWKSRAASVVLAGFTVAATLVGHPFWAFEGHEFQRRLTTTLEHLAIVGGLIAIASAGPGGFSFPYPDQSA